MRRKRYIHGHQETTSSQHQLTDDDNIWYRTSYSINEIFGVDIIIDDGIGCGYIVPSPETRSVSIGNYVSTPHG
jgi:hypothetical protein